MDKLSEADNYLMVFELITLVVFLVTLGAVGARFIFRHAHADPVRGGHRASDGSVPLALHQVRAPAGGMRTATTPSSRCWCSSAGLSCAGRSRHPQGVGL